MVSRAYNLTLNLQTTEALALLPNPATAYEHYVVILAQALELVITEDQSLYEEYHDHFQSVLKQKLSLPPAEDKFLQAETRLFWSFVYLKFGHELQAAWTLRQAHQHAKAGGEQFPDFMPLRKTRAVLEILLGSVPEKYNWVLGLMGMQGSLAFGLEELNAVMQTPNEWQREAALLYAILQGFVFQQPAAGEQRLDSLLEHAPDNRLFLFLAGGLSIKNANSEKALSRLLRLDSLTSGMPLHFAEYLKGEVYLHRGDYTGAIASYQGFISHYPGQHYIKDAWYKTGMSYWLQGEPALADGMFEKARRSGREDTEADKYAARQLASARMPHPALTRVRYFTDGGYYTEAARELNRIKPEALSEAEDQVAYHYRQARLAHLTGERTRARRQYLKTIEAAADQPWYYAPNACLQLGYLYLEEDNVEKATYYFRRARAYNGHEYKNSIDSKAKSALAQLRSRK